MFSRALGSFHRHRIPVIVGWFAILLAVLATGPTNTHATTYELTGDGLGLSQGNKGKSLTVSPELQLTSLTYGNRTGYPTGCTGTIYLHQDQGTGVQTTSWRRRGYDRINGYYTGAYESLVFNFSTAVSAQSIQLYLNRIHHHYESYGYVWIDIWVTPSSGSSFNISNVMSHFHSTGGDHDPWHNNSNHQTNGSESGYFDFSEIPELNGVGSLERIIVRAGRSGHFFINQIEYQLYLDNDDDGYPADDDCDDDDPDVNPGATEICNGIDDNCDGSVDEGCTTYYRDADEDGYGDPDDTLTDTSPPPGYVATGGDCNDSDASVYPGATELCNGQDDNCDDNVDEGCTLWYQDADGDTYGDPNDSSTYEHDGYTTQNSGDCDDTNAAVNPGETELCNGLDDNCDDDVDEGCTLYFRDADGDTFGDPGDVAVETSQPPGYVINGGDCDDTNASINPGATEICNGVDDNCDGNTDEGCTSYYRDADGDSYGDPNDSVIDTEAPEGYVANDDDCDDDDENEYPGADEQCDGDDDDCDGEDDEGCPTLYRDADGDGYGNPAGPTTKDASLPGYVANASDCDDTNGAINPGATEICNGIDDNCDGTTDEGCATYYRDADGDTYGDPGDSTTATSQPAGYVANAGDCNDANANINPGANEACNSVDDNCDGTVDEGCATYYRDADGDTYGDPGDSIVAPQQPAGYVGNAGDCDDTNGAINPGATEICNGVDDNCDGNIDEGCVTYYRDADGDTYGDAGDSTTATSQPAGYVTDSSDCDDTNGAINPGATEICNDVDDNCDGNIDEGCVTYYWDWDGDGFGNPGVSQEFTSPPGGNWVTASGDCDDDDNTVYPGASELCDGKDNDCDTQIDEGCTLLYWDGDSDGWGNPAGPTTTIPQSGYVANAGDCNDANASINPGATEACNSIDDNCDGTTDEGCATYYRDADGDTYGDPGDSTVATSQPAGYVTDSSDCDDTNGAINPGATEICNDVDDNCDGNIDEGCIIYYQDSDSDGFGNPAVSQEATSQPAGYVAATGDCNDNDNTVYPGATELCDGKDNDCDTQIDEGCTLLYWDGDSDGWGNPAGPTSTIPQSGYVANAGDCNDANASINPGATEICNGVDDNCDGTVDEGCATYYRDADGDTFGDPGDATTATSQPAGYVANAGDCNDANASINPGATEICNGVDDNCDGSLDEGCITYYRDADGDTFGDPGDATTATSQPAGYVANAGDCNDANASINPGATEICNSVDDNCDGTVDEGCNTYYRDADEDGFGDSGDSQLGGPTPPPGYVANDGDCDDTDDDIYPGATEQCNGVDDDCDGVVDDGCVTYYEDADGDGYGNPGETTTVNSPAPPPGFVSNDGDCNDNNANIHPGATEVIDGVDNNCNGQVDEGLCSDDCTTCDLNDDGVCDDEDLILFSEHLGWEEYDCDLVGDPICICDLVAPNRTCDGLDGICFYNAFERPECRVPLYIEKLRRKKSEPGDALRIIGKGFGNGSGGGQYSVVHIGAKKYEFGSSTKIKVWTDTKIKVKIPKKKYTKNSCAWFNGQDSRIVKVWVTVGGTDTNKMKLKLLKPDTCN